LAGRVLGDGEIWLDVEREGRALAGAIAEVAVVHANTNLTCIMIGERLADFLKEEAWGRNDPSPVQLASPAVESSQPTR
jgi:hypothetical protein